MDVFAQLENLQKQVNDTVTAVRSAATESRDQLKQRIDQAQVDANLALKDTEQKAGEAADRAQGKWAKIKSDTAAKMDDVKAKIDKRNAVLDASAAATDADLAEADASSAIDFATWAANNARVAALDALDARAYATELAKSASS